MTKTTVVCKQPVLEYFDPEVFLGLKVLAHFKLYQVFMSWIVLNIFKYKF